MEIFFPQPTPAPCPLPTVNGENVPFLEGLIIPEQSSRVACRYIHLKANQIFHSSGL